MLKHESPEEHPAAQVRVTPQELAKALARLEARQGSMDGTIPLGDAVQELGLNVTPEELLREIEAGRASSQENHLQTPVPNTNWPGVGAVFALALLLFGGMIAFLRTPISSQPAASPAVASVLPAPRAIPKPIALDPNMMVQDASGKLVMLSEVGDNQPVHCLLVNNSNGEQFFSYRPGYASEEVWTLVKHHGQVYVRGWTLRMSNKVLLTNGADVSAQASSPQFVAPISLSLKGFLVYPGAGSAAEFSPVKIHLDKYAWEKWKP